MTMLELARINNNIVVERLSLPDTVDLEQTFSEDFRQSLVECGKTVEVGWTLSDTGFTAPEFDLDAYRQRNIAALTAQCAAAIVGGYTSSALGSVHTYPSKTTDQINMMGSVSASLLPGLADDWSTPFWCADSDGVWAFRMHSIAQIQTAGADGKAHVVLCQSTLQRLTLSVMAATTAEAIAEVIWPSA